MAEEIDKNVSFVQSEEHDKPDPVPAMNDDTTYPKQDDSDGSLTKGDENLTKDEADGQKSADSTSLHVPTTPGESLDSKETPMNPEVVTLSDRELPKLKISTEGENLGQNLPSTQKLLSDTPILTKSEKELKTLCTNMFAKLQGYLEGEVASSVDDYALLERMNQSTIYKYQDMLKAAVSVHQAMHEVNHKFTGLQTYLEQVEQIENEVLALEKAAYKLDGYAKSLEEKFRKLGRR